MARRRAFLMSMFAAPTAATFVLPTQPAHAALSQCTSGGYYGCAWDGTSYSSSFWGINGTGGPGPGFYCQMSDLGPWNNRISSYRNNTTYSQQMWTSTSFAGSRQSFGANGNYSTVTYNNNYESWKGSCNPL